MMSLPNKCCLPDSSKFSSVVQNDAKQSPVSQIVNAGVMRRLPRVRFFNDLLPNNDMTVIDVTIELERLFI